MRVKFLIKETMEASDGVQTQDWLIMSQTCYPLFHDSPQSPWLVIGLGQEIMLTNNVNFKRAYKNVIYE